MPYKPKKPCTRQGCPNLIHSGSYCEQHTPKKIDRRESSWKRGYNKEYKEIREMLLSAYPVCQDCKRNPSKVAHHIPDYVKGTSHYDYDYLALCERCHNRRTGKAGRK